MGTFCEPSVALGEIIMRDNLTDNKLKLGFEIVTGTQIRQTVTSK